jgi:hypothetical protein
MTRNSLPTIIFVALILAAMVRPLWSEEAATNPAGAEIEQLIQQLDSNRYQERERATQLLVEAGGAAVDPLLAAANGKSPEAADRAVWVLRKLGDSSDHELALAALERLVKVEQRPAVVADARRIQSRLRLGACQERLSKLGGQLSTTDFAVVDVGAVTLVRLQLDENWRGSVDDLKCLLALDQQHYFRLIGPRVDDEVVQLFATKDNLRQLQIFMSSVSPAAVDFVKERQPKAVVYIRNRALLGISGESQANGVRVQQAQDAYGAAKAGILVNDVVTKIDGKPLKDFDRLTAIISQYQPGDVVEVTILRGEETLTKQVTLSDQPPE